MGDLRADQDGDEPGETGSIGLDELYRIFVEGSDDLMTVVDLEGRFLYVNPASERFLGVPAEECLGLEAFEFIHPDDGEQTRRAFTEWLAIRDDRTVYHENRQVSRSGRVRDVLWTIRPRFADGRLVSFYSSGRDITDRKDAERRVAESDARHRSVLAGTLDPLLTIDPDGTVVSASDSIERVFGYAPDEIIGQNIRLLMPEPHRSQHDGYLANYAETGATSILGQTREFDVVRKDGALITCELSVSRVDVPGREQPLFTGSFRDVTERKRAQEAELSMLRALATVGESAAIMAHEIKNPITAVNLALRAVADQLGQEHKDVLDDMAWRLGRLQQLMRQTLSFVRPLEVEPESLDVALLLDETVAELQPHLDRTFSRVTVETEPEDLRVWVDGSRMAEVLMNLIQNSLEAADGPRTVAISARRTASGQVRILVDDDGPGIPDDIRTTIFRPFVTKKQEGTGLGLPICRRIIEEHRGSIDVVDGVMGGAAFEILVPEAP